MNLLLYHRLVSFIGLPKTGLMENWDDSIEDGRMDEEVVERKINVR